jgi:uncharacterized protein YbjT (DUF2867 family)
VLLSVVAASTTAKPVLVTGASGYIGGRLVPRLLAAGYRVRCLAREPRKLTSRSWAADPRVEILRGDTSDAPSLQRALAGCGAAYYLVHSLVAAGRAYAERDRTMAGLFARAAEEVGLERIIYLGGLGELGQGLSEHLVSRREVETVLASGRTPVTVLRAAVILGSGSASFEILRYLVERLPVMITPRWVRTESQPIAVRNVVGYLVDCLEAPQTQGRIAGAGLRHVPRRDRRARSLERGHAAGDGRHSHGAAERVGDRGGVGDARPGRPFVSLLVSGANGVDSDIDPALLR